MAYDTACPLLVFSPFFVSAGLILVVFLSYYTTRKIKNNQIPGLLFLCGIVLAASECYKQLFLYYVVNDQTYNWWYFSISVVQPSYVFLSGPAICALCGKKTVLYTFMQDFNLLGGIMALAEPSGLFHPYWVLTIHGLIWHLLLIYIGLVIAFSRCSDTTTRGFVRTLPLFFVCCIVASIINRTAKPLGQADMFYISPYYPSAQIVFHDIAIKYRIPSGMPSIWQLPAWADSFFTLIFGKFIFILPGRLSEGE